MIKKRLMTGIYLFLFLVTPVTMTTAGNGLHAAERTLIKNAAIFLPEGTWQPDSFIIINGCKIEKTGPMKSLKPGDVFDMEYDLKGMFVYPGFIDPLYKGFQKIEKKKPEEPGQTPDESTQRRRRDEPREVEEAVRKPFEKRNYFIKRRAVEQLEIDAKKTKELIGSGFAVVHVVPAEGILAGATAVISLASDNSPEAVLVPERFMAFFLQPNNSDYPVTPPGIIAELIQLKADIAYYRTMKQLQFLHPFQRLRYIPELDILYPYFTKEKQFLIVPTSYTEQRMAEILRQQVGIEPVLVSHPEVWRRDVPPGTAVILPLDFKPREGSKYAGQGEALKKEAEEKIYPQKLAEFFKTHANISLAAPGDDDGKSDYKTLYKNIRVLMKQGLTEADIVAALTVKPAALLNISKYVGVIEPGKLANLAAWDKKIADPRAKVKMAFVEGKTFEFEEDKKEEKGKNKDTGKKKKQETETEPRKGTPVKSKGPVPGQAEAPAYRELLLKNADIYTFDRGVLRGYDLLIREGKIADIAQNISIKPGPGARIIDLSGKSVIPGIIDSHNHIGLAGEINEYSENITPEIKMEYMVNPDDPRIYYSLTGGMTTTHTMHGSANPIGGENVVIKLKWGKPAEEMIERRAPRTLKMALGENPKMRRGRFPDTRMGTSYAIEKAYMEALQYREKWRNFREKWEQTPEPERDRLIPPRKDYRMEALLDTLDGKMVIRCHSYRAEETLELIRLSKKYGFTIAAFEHLHQAYRIADELKAGSIAVSIFADSWNYKAEASEFSPWGLKLLHEKGVIISLNSDTAEIMRRFNMEAGKMRRYAGMNDLDALKTITLNAAKILGVDRFTGSIEIGKDADLAVFDGYPLSSMSKCVLTLIEGQIYFDRARDPYAGVKE
jgi:imidazolonepropionase-like amidohydrolase